MDDEKGTQLYRIDAEEHFLLQAYRRCHPEARQNIRLFALTAAQLQAENTDSAEIIPLLQRQA